MVCRPGFTNQGGQILDGAPAHERVVVFSGGSVGLPTSPDHTSTKAGESLEDQIDADAMLNAMVEQAVVEARNICRLRCCPAVTIRFFASVDSSWPGRFGGGFGNTRFPSARSPMTIKCRN